jgi:DNA modification methylase
MITLHQGHVIDILRGLETGRFHVTITSPPYWKLRDYSLPPVEWPTVTYRPMAGLPEVTVQGCEEGCEHEWIPLGTKEAKALAQEMRTSFSVHQIREGLATADVEVNDEAPIIDIKSTTEAVVNKESVQIIGKVLASSREGRPSRLADASITIEDASDKIPGVTNGNVRDAHNAAFPGMDTEIGKSVSQHCRPDAPPIGNAACVDMLSTDRGIRSDKALDKLDQASIFPDEADRAILSDISIGQHQADEIGEIGRPGNEVFPKDGMPIGTIGGAPLISTTLGTELMGGHLAMPSGPQDNSTAKFTLNGDSGISTGTGTIPPLPNKGGLDAESLSATLTKESDAHNVPSICAKCGGVKCCLGLESTPSAYVAHLVAVFREVWRVLRDDGTLWLNLASSYAANRGYQVPDGKWHDVGNNHGSSIPPGFKQKDLVPIPWLVALALQADGWYLRRDCIWAKGRDFDVGDNGYGASMPESCEDRPVSSHEYVFLLTKKARYYYDAVAVRQKWDGGEHHLRSVWLLNTSGYKEAHFATFCERLPETCIRASTSERGVCPECGAQWERVTEHHRRTETDSFCPKHLQGETSGLSNPGWRKKEVPNAYTETTGWRPTCTCPPAEPIPATVMDIFSGAATTLLVADRLGRDGFGIDQSAEYIKMSYDRLVEDGPMFADVRICR